MKFFIPQSVFSEALFIASKGIGHLKNPILESLLIKAGEKLEITGNNLDMQSTCILNADVVQEGEILVDARYICNIVRLLKDEMVCFETKENNVVTITCGDSFYDMIGLDTEGFPNALDYSEEASFIINSTILKELVRKTAFSAASENIAKPILKGLLTKINENEVKCVAVDGYRVAISKENLNLDAGEHSFIVLAKEFNDILKIINEDTNIKVTIDKNYVALEFDNNIVVLRKMSGEYLNYENVIPKESKFSVSVDSAELMRLLERSAIVAESVTTGTCPVHLIIENKKLKIKCENQNMKVEDSISIETTNDDFFEIGFNHKYILEPLKEIKDKNVVLRFTTDVTPVVISPVEGEKYQYIILPMRIRK